MGKGHRGPSVARRRARGRRGRGGPSGARGSAPGWRWGRGGWRRGSEWARRGTRRRTRSTRSWRPTTKTNPVIGRAGEPGTRRSAATASVRAFVATARTSTRSAFDRTLARQECEDQLGAPRSAYSASGAPRLVEEPDNRIAAGPPREIQCSTSLLVEKLRGRCRRASPCPGPGERSGRLGRPRPGLAHHEMASFSTADRAGSRRELG